MFIKKASVNDAQTISSIHALSWKSAYKGLIPKQYLDELKNDFWVKAFEDWIESNKVTSQIIYDNDLPVGCIAYGKSRDDKFPSWGEIISIYFIPSYIGKGYGKKLVDTCLSHMKSQGFNDVYLWVLENNIYARKFYEKVGFYCTNDTYCFKILDQPLTDVRYVIHL